MINLKVLTKEDDFFEEIKEGNVIIDFFAVWCGPCKALTPILHAFAEKNPSVKILKIDVDDFPEIAKAHNIFCMPTIMMYQDGKITSNIQRGVNSKLGSVLEGWITK